MFSRCDNESKITVPLEAEVIPVLHSVAEANATDESDGVAKQEDEQIGIFQILDKLEEAVDALLNASSSLLQPQLEVKTMQKPYGCSLCNKSFSRKRDVKRHMRVHNGEKLYSCSQCSKSFAHSSKLQVHLRVHSGEKPYSCSQCSKSFARSSAFKVHLRIHSGKKPYSCSQCSKSLASPYALKVHLRIHSGEKPYSCVKCLKSFTTDGNLRRHVKSGVCSRSAEVFVQTNT